MNKIKQELEDYKLLLRNVPGLVVTLFVISVICMNLMANRELFHYQYFALDCGVAWSWLSFLCMDVICKRFGPKAAVKISALAVGINLFTCLMFQVLCLAPGNWGEFYSFGLIDVNTALNNTFSGSWYIVVCSSIAMLISSAVNAFLNHTIGKLWNKKDNFKEFALRSYLSTGVAQYVDNFVFATLVSKYLFGWTWTQVLMCSLITAMVELLAEVIFGPVGYRMSKNWEKENVGSDYIEYLEKKSN